MTAAGKRKLPFMRSLLLLGFAAVSMVAGCAQIFGLDDVKSVDGPLDGPLDGPILGCNADPGKCTGATLVCDTPADVCVECTVANAAACMGMEPVCGVDYNCRGCTEHSECASAVCLPDGSCAAETDVAYVTGGSGTGTTCTKAAPCATVTAALATAKAIVKVTGTVKEAEIVITGATAKMIFGASGAKLEGTQGGENLVELRDSAVLTIHDLIVGGSADFYPPACFALMGAASLTVNKGKIEHCRVGIMANGGTVTVTGSTVSGNIGGGIAITGGSFKLVNNFIVDNGSADNGGSFFGGVRLDSATATNQFDQNTVVYNHQSPSVGGAAGVICLLTNFAAARNIISSNNAGFTFGPQTAGGCTFPASYVMPDRELNTLGFANINTLNFHLTAASPAMVRDVPGLTTCAGNDIDGDARPFNGLCDLGADEYKP